MELKDIVFNYNDLNTEKMVFNQELLLEFFNEEMTLFLEEEIKYDSLKEKRIIYLEGNCMLAHYMSANSDFQKINIFYITQQFLLDKTRLENLKLGTADIEFRHYKKFYKNYNVHILKIEDWQNIFRFDFKNNDLMGYISSLFKSYIINDLPKKSLVKEYKELQLKNLKSGLKKDRMIELSKHKIK